MVTNFTMSRHSKLHSFYCQIHNWTIVGFITESKSIKFTMKKFAVHRTVATFQDGVVKNSFSTILSTIFCSNYIVSNFIVQAQWTGGATWACPSGF